MDYRNGKIAQLILELQNEDGTWGDVFHSFAIPNNKTRLTTEQALRRLKILGFTMNDAPIRRAVNCMVSCMRGERKIDNYWEKTLDWDLYTKLMLSTWIRIYDPNNPVALEFAGKWANIIEKAFENGMYDDKAYRNAYQWELYQGREGKKEIGFMNFYQINLLQGLLSERTENCLLDYILQSDSGIYYVYNKPIRHLPAIFASMETSRYLAAIDILSGYEAAKEKLVFVTEWLEKNKDENGQWDLGSKVRDNIYFPLSDSWRAAENRKEDCTYKISMILQKLGEPE